MDPFAEARTRRSSHAAVANLAVPAPLVSQEKPPSTKVRVKKNLAAAHTHPYSHTHTQHGLQQQVLQEQSPGEPDNFEAVVVMTDPHDWFEVTRRVHASMSVCVYASMCHVSFLEFGGTTHVVRWMPNGFPLRNQKMF